jgi:lon-related putative ATP-dependent protease
LETGNNRWNVRAQDLRWRCDPNQFKFKSTEEIEPLVGVVGQDRAIHSFDFGVKIKTRGFNLYAAGPMGTGKHSAVTSYVKELAADQEPSNDWCYVYNFKNPDNPVAVPLPTGKASGFAKEMEELVEACKTEIPKAFDSEEYERRKDAVVNDFQAKRDAGLKELRDEAAARDFSVELTTAGIVTIPIVAGRLMKRDEYDQLPEDEKQDVKRQTEELQQEINRVMTSIRSMEKEAKSRLQELDKEIALFAVGHLLDDLRHKYSDYSKITDYLSAIQEDIVENLEHFKSTEKKGAGLALAGLEMPEKEPPFEKYKVNLFVDNTNLKGAPVVFEPNPTYYNLFGRVEYAARMGGMTTNFTMIKPGAIHRANGGYLILNSLDLLLNFMSYDALKRTLKTHQSRIENIGDQFRVVPVVTLRPESIPVDVKVILVGNRNIYNLLYNLDEDFKKLFKVKADFNVEMTRTGEHTEKYAALIGARCKQEKLKHYDPTGVAKIVEYGARLAEDQTKLSTRFIEINDLVSEASYWASTNGNTHVTAGDVDRAIEERIYRSNMIEEKLRELIADGTMMIDTEGESVGQVNGLAVIFLGDYMFGRPSRITSKVYAGKKGILNIERESKMSGRIHDKAVFILSGYLGGRFAQDKPLAITATIGFEQSYEMIEGDSASSTELYALISSLAEVPLKQNIAVTGSVNQQGEIQPIGGVNRKIEGFFDVCKVKGFTGHQGVLIPRRNLKNLMLREDVVEAVQKGEWHIWAIDTIDQGLEILTGKPAGKRQADGSWEPQTINWLVDQKLARFAKQAKRFETGEAGREAA